MFTSPEAVLAAGFTTSSPEYIAAQIYFSQQPAAAQMALGRQDLTALGAITVDGRADDWSFEVDPEIRARG